MSILKLYLIYNAIYGQLPEPGFVPASAWKLALMLDRFFKHLSEHSHGCFRNAGAKLA